MKKKLFLLSAHFIKTYGWDILSCLVFITFSIVIWLPSRNFPLFWDSTYVVNTARDIAKSGFTLFSSSQLGYAHTTLYSTALAIIWHFFGYSTTVSHFLSLPFLPMLLISTYFIVKQTTNRELGFLAATLVAFTPTVLAEYMNVYVDLPTGALVLAATFFWHRNRRLPWAILFGAAILTKITALIAVPYFCIESIRQKKNRILSLIFPLTLSLSWFSYHYIVTGWWFNKRDSDQHLAILDGIQVILNNWLQVFYHLVLGQGRWLLVLLGIICIVLLIRLRANIFSLFTTTPIISIVCMAFFAALFYAVTGEFSYRYAILVYPFFVYLISILVYKIISRHNLITALAYTIMIAILCYMATQWHPKENRLSTTRYQPPTDLSVLDYIYIFRWLGYYGQTNNSESTIYYGAFPENNAFLEPRMGYVVKPLRFQPCDTFKEDSTNRQIIIFHPFSPSQYACYSLIKNRPFIKIAGIEQNGKWIDIYESSPSAIKATKTTR